MVLGCTNVCYDNRLADVDSMMDLNPDSALSILRSMESNVFERSDDRAYYYLLITQANYKCYQPVNNIDTIELAVSH